MVRNPFWCEVRAFERGGEIGKVVPFFSWFTVPKSEDALSRQIGGRSTAYGIVISDNFLLVD